MASMRSGTVSFLPVNRPLVSLSSTTVRTILDDYDDNSRYAYAGDAVKTPRATTADPAVKGRIWY